MGSSNMKKLGAKIIGFKVLDNKAQAQAIAKPAPVSMHEGIERAEVLPGFTYKIKPMTLDAAIYVTINNIVLPDGQVRPYEIFVNTKDITALQWMIAVTRMVSAVFRKGGDCTFVVEELKSVCDPKGGYFGTGGVWRNSVVAEIGDVIERHLTGLGMLGEKPKIAPEELSNAQVCGKCHEKTLVVLDGCLTCLSCGNSKCN